VRQRLHGLPHLPRPTLSLAALNLIIAAVLVTLYNLLFWRGVLQATGGLRWDNALFLASLALLVLVLVNLLLTAITWGKAAKPVLLLLLCLSAAVTYFEVAYGVVFDRSMIANIVETHREEVVELAGVKLFAWLALFGVLPGLLLTWVRIANPPLRQRVRSNLHVLAASIAVIVVGAALFYQQYAGLVRNHRELRYLLVPSNYLSASYGYLKRRVAGRREIEIVGSDAHRVTTTAGSDRPILTLLVIGETARASEFSLDGYPRMTNPRLSREDVVFFRHTRSCGTSTAVSLPCMFMDVGRAGYRDSMAHTREGLLDVMQRAGVAVLWRENNSGCKGACDRVPHEDLSHAAVPGLCAQECFDEILLHGLQDHLDRLHGDAVVVLHMKGSHGPAYYLRYPPQFEAFKPTCQTSELGSCERAAVVNAYDNSIRYSDHVLAEALALLKRNAERFDSALLYVSDHGESLGENGVYLHGLPYVIAPEEQVHVPMLAWLSEGVRTRLGLDAGCLRASAGTPHSHDDLFHSVVGLHDVRTAAYRAEHDLFRGCRARPRLEVQARAG
jgi:lipid A ethanolaminephosphotransferase